MQTPGRGVHTATIVPAVVGAKAAAVAAPVIPVRSRLCGLRSLRGGLRVRCLSCRLCTC